MEKNNTLIVIPSRWGSTRLPGKPLKLLCGKPLISWVIEAALKVKNASGIVVATDNEEIKRVGSQYNIQTLITSSKHRNGTERLLEVASKINADYYINLQGDEPLIDPKDIEILIDNLIKMNEDIITLCHEITEKEASDISRVKLVCNLENEAIYFSRNKIPFGELNYLQHIGIYGFKRKSLEIISNLKETRLEKLESLEQLRWVENNLKIKVIPTKNEAIGVDTLNDLKEVEKILKFKQIKIIFSDVDGILTDGRIWYGKTGEEIKAFHSRDGLAIKLLLSSGIKFALISARDSEPLRKRIEDLGIKYFCLGQEDKVMACKQILKELKIDKENAAFIGDDNIDIPAMKFCGWSFTVADAIFPVVKTAKTLLSSKGGEGAIREIADLILN